MKGKLSTVAAALLEEAELWAARDDVTPFSLSGPTADEASLEETELWTARDDVMPFSPSDPTADAGSDNNASPRTLDVVMLAVNVYMGSSWASEVAVGST